MSEHSHLSAEPGHDGQFALERRGYSRMQVDEAIAQMRLESRGLQDSRRDLEDRLSQALDEIERLKLDLSAARSSGRPPHEEISERIGQILKLADDEAKSQRSKADDEIAKLRSDAQAETTKLRADAKAETDRSRAEAQEQAERMLSAAQEQAETTVATAKTEAETTRKSAVTEAQQVISDATKQAETAVATAKSQAKQQVDEATARATAIHDGAERRLNLLMSRHTETMRRLTEIRDVVTTLVAGEADRGSLEDEVARIVAGAVNGEGQPGRPAGNGRAGGPGEGRHAGGAGQPDGQPALSTAQRPGMAGPHVGGRPGPGQHDARPQPGAVAPAQAGPAATQAGSAVPTQPGHPVPAAASPAGAHPSPARGARSVPPAAPPTGPGAPAGPSGASGVAPEADDTATGVKIVTD